MKNSTPKEWKNGNFTEIEHHTYVPLEGYEKGVPHYCFDENDERVETIVLEVNNTPWGERHCYVMPCADGTTPEGYFRFQRAKVFHVSPFMPMDMDYDWRFNQPNEALTVHMENARSGEKVFDATLVLKRREITAASLAGVLLSFPLMTVKVVAAIYWQALRLWLKSVPVHDHPDKRAALEDLR